MNTKNRIVLLIVGIAINSLLMLATQQVQAQDSTRYFNEWINYSQTYYKIKVVKDGLYRIPKTLIEENGLTLNSNAYKLYHKGEEVPIYVSNSGTLENNDYIEFYGEKNDGEFDTQLYWYEAHQPTKEISLFTDTATYYLTSENGPLTNRFQPTENNLAGAPTAETHFVHTNRVITANQHYGGTPFRIGGVNNNFADFEEGEGFLSSSITIGTELQRFVSTRGLYTGPGSFDAIFNTKVASTSNELAVSPDHHLQILINDNLHLDTLYEGYQFNKHNFTIPLAQLGDSVTSVKVKSLDDISSVNTNAISYVSITYPHNYDFENRKDFKFTIDNTSDKYLEITNFDGGSIPLLYDLTNYLRIEPVVENNTYKFHLTAMPDNGATRELFIVNSTATTSFLPTVKIVDQLETINFTDFSNLAQQGNYIMLSHPKLMEGGVNQVSRYKQHRESELGGNYQVTVINIEELYDQFAWGIRKHPLSVRIFLKYAIENWSVAPEYVLLLGKSVNYVEAYPPSTSDATRFENCLIPTYGVTPSDEMLVVSQKYVWSPQLAIGRVPAKTPQQVRIYLDKIIEHDFNRLNPGCTREERAWMKDALHLAGGSDLDESLQFLEYLKNYEDIYEDSIFAGRVVATYNRLTEEVIETIDVGEFINNGLAVINFVGHSSGEYWDLDIQSPEDYENYGRYPFIITGSCWLGDIHTFRYNDEGEVVVTMPEEYLFADSLGAIGFLATASIGFPNFLDIYGTGLYNNFCKLNYNEPIGKSIKENVNAIFLDDPARNGTKITSQEYTLAGDPALIINSFEQAELIVEASDVSFTPPQITADLDSFAINIVVTNLGRAVSNQMVVNVEQTFPDGSIENITSQAINTPIYADTITLYIAMGDPTNVAGEHQFTVTVDYNDEVAENCEDNNSVSLTNFVFSDLIVPIAPCNFAIVGQSNITLSASTGQPILAAYNYKMEIDTSELFVSPLAQTNINSVGGVIQWKPDLDWQNETVYYWRAAREEADSTRWRGSSFVYITDAPTGWNQSHYFQIDKNQYEQIVLDSLGRDLVFADQVNKIRATTEYANSNGHRLFVNDLELSVGTCIDGATCRGGLAFALFKPGFIIETVPSIRLTGIGCNGVGTYNNIHCVGSELYRFEFNTNTTEQLEALSNFLDNEIPDGYYVLAYGVKEHRLNNLPEPYQTSVQNFFTGMGINNMADADTISPFLALGRYNIPDYDYEMIVAPDTLSEIEITHLIDSKAITGKVKSTPVGPATNWEQVSWDFIDVETPIQDQLNIKVYGVGEFAEQELLSFDNATLTGNLDISSISATQHPFIRLEAQLSDSIYFTPAQFGNWRTLFTRAPEAALNQQNFFSFTDTLKEGETIALQMAVTNPEATDMDSLLVAYTIIDANNVSHEITMPAQAPIAAGETIITNFNYSSLGFTGNNILVVNINPNQTQAEKYNFNNLMYLPFHVVGDKLNPLIDVTFDGRRILDGDIISAKPNILVSIKDENRYLSLNDTSDFYLALKYPDEYDDPIFETPIAFSSPYVNFTPPSASETAAGNNKAQIEINPEFLADGTYALVVRAKDKTGNNFAKEAYEISFKVYVNTMISNLLNYPNPFTSQTKFVFTLTGSEIPEYCKIQIMTISGKVVREITQAELGTLHIGNNITDYVWDGTDQFGNPLANGLYLYRVITRMNGQAIDHFDTNMDKYFKNNLGKMYLMR